MATGRLTSQNGMISDLKPTNLMGPLETVDVNFAASILRIVSEDFNFRSVSARERTPISGLRFLHFFPLNQFCGNCGLLKW